MVWGCFSENRVGILAFPKEKIDSIKYTDILNGY